MKRFARWVVVVAGLALASGGQMQGAESTRVKLGPDSTLTAGLPGTGTLSDDELRHWLGDPKNHEALEVELPLGMALGASGIVGLEHNSLTRAKVELGRQLYFDPRLSKDGTVSCASCHDPQEGFAKHTTFGVGIRGQKGGRNSPAAYNRILSGRQFWDGRADSLEDQAVGPIQNPIEMGNTHPEAVATLKGISGYVLQFDKIFPDGITIENVGRAIAAFERTLVTGPSAYDAFVETERLGKLSADEIDEDDDLKAQQVAAKAILAQRPFSESARRGRDLFFSEQTNCTACHAGANFSDEQYYNLGVGMAATEPDLGRHAISQQTADRGAFKTPTLRNVAQTAPYMHDGSQQTLAEVIEWYAKGGHPNDALSSKLKPLKLSAQDKADLVAFLEALTGDFPKVAAGRLPK